MCSCLLNVNLGVTQHQNFRTTESNEVSTSKIETCTSNTNKCIQPLPYRTKNNVKVTNQIASMRSKRLYDIGSHQISCYRPLQRPTVLEKQKVTKCLVKCWFQEAFWGRNFSHWQMEEPLSLMQQSGVDVNRV